MDDNLQKAVEVFDQGGIVIFPTDTAFGIGCRLDKPESIDRLFSIRKRPLSQATPVLVSSIDMALAYFDSPPDIVRHLMEKYWPGALTIVSRCKKDLVHSPVRGGGETIGLRMPDHQDLLKVISEVGVPILGPSANFHGNQTPFTQSELDPELVKLVDFVLPGECKVKQVSTVVDASIKPPAILRQGVVKLSDIIKKPITLYIDTTDSSKTVVAVGQDGKRNELVEATDPSTKSQNVLPLIEKVLKETNLELKDLTEIEVSVGPGSFTGTRVGVSVANVLGWALGIPVNGKKQVTPVYSASKFD